MAYESIEINPTEKFGTNNTLNIDFTNKRVSAHLNYVNFEDHGHVVVYIPSLNLSSYGNTLEDAQRMMVDVVLDDFYDNILTLPRFTAFEYLSSLGWKAAQPELFSNCAYVDREGILRDFQLPENTIIQENALELA